MEIHFYEAANGNCPVDKFIESQEKRTKAKILSTLHFLAETSNQPPHHIFQKMSGTQNLWEIRVRHAGNIYRLLCFFDGEQVVILTHAFQKKTQKTPRQEIDTAEKRKADYLKRK
jgi:phage-related protein